MYWAVAGCYAAFGPSEWAMRAMPVLFALGGVLLTYAAGRGLHGRAAGVAAAAALGPSRLYFAIAHILLLDMAGSVPMNRTPRWSIPWFRTSPGAARPL